jgi:hypothetical protein
MRFPLIRLALLGLLAASGPALADDPEFRLTIRNHRFEPPTLQVPANTKVKLLVENADPTPEEFESYELNREKVIPGGSKGVVYVGPLRPGTYPFFGDFNQKTAQGQIIAR